MGSVLFVGLVNTQLCPLKVFVFRTFYVRTPCFIWWLHYGWMGQMLQSMQFHLDTKMQTKIRTTPMLVNSTITKPLHMTPKKLKIE